MADLKKTVEVIFGGKNEFSGIIGDFERDFNRLNYSVNTIATPLAGVTNSILKVDAALAAMAVGGMAYAIRAAGEFNGKFGEITTLITDTGKPVDEFKAKIKDYAVDSVKSIDEINSAIYGAISAGVDYKDSIDFVSAAEKLSVAGRADLGDTTKALISTLNAYGQSTDQAGKYSDIMFTTVRLGQTTLEELSSQLAKVAGLAANSGVPFETLSAAIAALTVAGLPTEQAITGLKAALTNIIKPTDEAEKLAAKLGIQFNATALQTKGFEGVLWDAWKATGGNTEQMAKLFGSTEALNAVLVLASDKTGKFKEALLAMKDAAGATQTAYDKVADEFKNINQRLVNSFTITLGEIGEKLMPQYGNIAKSLSELLKGIKVGIDAGAFDPLFKQLDATGKSISDWVKQVAASLPEALKQVDFTGLAAAFKRVEDAVKAFFDTDASKPKELAEAIQLVVDTVETLVDVSRGIGESFKPFIDVTKDAVKAFNSLDEKTKELIGNILGLATAYKLLGPKVTLVMLALSTDSKDAATAMNNFFAAFENGANAIKVGVTALGLVFASATLSVAEFLDALPGYDNTAGVARAKERVEILTKALKEYNEDLEKSSLKVLNAFSGADTAAGKLITTTATAKSGLDKYGAAINNIPSAKTTQLGVATGDAKAAIDKHNTAIGGIPGTKTTQMEISGSDAANRVAEVINNIPSKKEVTIEVRADGATIEKAFGLIIERFPDGATRIVQGQMTVDEWNLAATKKKIDDAVPAAKVMEIQAKIDTEKIKASSDIVQKSIEWTAKLDIARVMAQAEVLTAAFKSIDNTITSTGQTLSNMTDSYASIRAAGQGGGSFVEQQISEEGARRNRALDQQEKMTNAQVDQMKAITDNIKQGKALIEIDGKGLQPHLEAFMFEILSAIQVKANAEGMKFLVGTT